MLGSIQHHLCSARGTTITIHQLRLNRLSSTASYQTLTGHIESPTRPHCSNGDETAEHLLLLCPKWETERQRYFGDSIDITDVFQDCESLVEFLISSGHLSPHTGSTWRARHDNNNNKVPHNHAADQKLFSHYWLTQNSSACSSNHRVTSIERANWLLFEVTDDLSYWRLHTELSGTAFAAGTAITSSAARSISTHTHYFLHMHIYVIHTYINRYIVIILTRLNAFTRSCLFNASAIQITAHAALFSLARGQRYYSSKKKMIVVAPQNEN